MLKHVVKWKDMKIGGEFRAVRAENEEHWELEEFASDALGKPIWIETPVHSEDLLESILDAAAQSRIDTETVD